MEKKELFQDKLVVINVGVRPFYEGVKAQGVEAVQVAWRPPSNPKLAKLLGKVM